MRPPDQPSGLALPKGIADGNGKCRHPVPAELIGQVGHVVDVELWLHEDIALDVKLHAGAAVDLKMIGVDARGEA